MALKEIEKAEVTCLVDNNIDVTLPNTQVACRPSLGENWFERTLIAEHGFSVSIKLELNGNEHRLLFDSGLNPLSVAHNADILDLDLRDCKLVVSSHEHAFRKRMVKLQDGRSISLPAPGKSILINSGYDIIEKHSHSLWIEDNILVTGEIPRTNDFENGFPNHYSEVDGNMESDPLIRDDQAIILNIKDKGLAVITGCGHSGIINTLKYAKELTGEDRIYAVMGGIHLTGGIFEAIIPRTIDELEELKPKFMIPCHCSGLKAINEIVRAMPNVFIQNSVGTKYIL